VALSKHLMFFHLAGMDIQPIMEDHSSDPVLIWTIGFLWNHFYWILPSGLPSPHSQSFVQCFTRQELSRNCLSLKYRASARLLFCSALRNDSEPSAFCGTSIGVGSFFQEISLRIFEMFSVAWSSEVSHSRCCSGYFLRSAANWFTCWRVSLCVICWEKR